MGVNWVSLAQKSVGWLFGPPGRADGDWRLQSSRIGKVSGPTGDVPRFRGSRANQG